MTITAGQIPFQEAIEFFRGKVNMPTERWDDLRHGAHVRAFSVAGMMRDDWLSEIRAAIDKAQESGTGLKAFQAGFDDFVKRTGWQFYGRGKTEEERSAWRSRLIYKTNMRVSYMAGRYKQLTDPDVLKYRPYWQYKHSGSMHPRKLHLSWNGTVLAATDPAWDVMFPPNGWGCGCDVIALSRRQLAAMGKSGPDQSPLQSYIDKDPRTDQDEVRYIGIDRGWEYNPGKEWLDGLVPRQMHEPLPPAGTISPPPTLPPLPAATSVPASSLLPKGLQDLDYVNAFLNEFGISAGQTTAFRDKAGGIIQISEGLFQDKRKGKPVGWKVQKNGREVYMSLLADTLREPDEIWVDWDLVGKSYVLKRAYIRRVVLPDGAGLLLRFSWSKAGWAANTAFQPEFDQYLLNLRTGVLVYRKK